MADETMRVNGRAFDRNSVIFDIKGVKYFAIKSIKWTNKRTRGRVPAFNRSGRDAGRGKGKYEGGTLTLTCVRATAQSIREQLAKLSDDGHSYGDPEVPITLQTVEKGMKPIKDEFLEACLLDEGGGAESESADPMMEDLNFDFLRKKTNGLYLYASTPR